MKFLRDFNFKGKRVLLRAGFNVPLNENGEISDDFRIKSVLPTIEYLRDHKAKIILLSHFGRPNGKIVEELRVDLIGKRISELLNQSVKKLNDCIGPEVEQAIKEMDDREVILLENVQFYPGEKRKDLNYIKSLASLADFFVLDAFGQAHRDYASISGLSEYLPSCAGLLLEKEINILSDVLENAKRPLAVIIGGSKISTKIKFMKKFLIEADDVLLGGALANTVIAAKGFAIGKSIYEQKMIENIKKINLTNTKLHLPVDAIASTDPFGKESSRIAPIGKTEEDEMILDIGPDTINLFKNIISQAKTVIWNGPMGIIEVDKFVNGSIQVAQLIANSQAFSMVGGGDSLFLLKKANLLDKINHICTGGGAMLNFLAEEKLPGIEALN